MVRILEADRLEIKYGDDDNPQYLRVVEKGRVFDFEWELAKKMAGEVRKGPIRDKAAPSNDTPGDSNE